MTLARNSRADLQSGENWRGREAARAGASAPSPPDGGRVATRCLDLCHACRWRSTFDASAERTWVATIALGTRSHWFSCSAGIVGVASSCARAATAGRGTAERRAAPRARRSSTTGSSGGTAKARASSFIASASGRGERDGWGKAPRAAWTTRVSKNLTVRFSALRQQHRPPRFPASLRAMAGVIQMEQYSMAMELRGGGTRPLLRTGRDKRRRTSRPSPARRWRGMPTKTLLGRLAWGLDMTRLVVSSVGAPAGGFSLESTDEDRTGLRTPFGAVVLLEAEAKHRRREWLRGVGSLRNLHRRGLRPCNATGGVR